MLVEFNVTNFLSIAERQTLNLTVAYSATELADNVIRADVPSMAGLSFLKGAALYGANASGKSNVLAAMEFMRKYVRNSATELKPDEVTHVAPFLLREDTISAPSEFEVVFVHKNVRYEYGFSLDKRRILSEWLYAYPKGKPRKVFCRYYDEKTARYSYDFGKGSAQYADLTQKTRPNALFLSVAVQFNATDLMAPYEWFEAKLRSLNLSDGSLLPVYTAKKILEEPRLRKLYSDFLRAADVGIETIDVTKQDFDESKAGFPDDMPGEIRKMLLSNLKGEEILDIGLLHARADTLSPLKLEWELESAGTQRLFSLLGPWHDVLTRGITLFVDEFEASMHPLLTRKLLMMICGPENTSGAQLIFTTHNTNLLDSNLLRRDQIWFTEKDHGGATHLYPLSDYRPRKDESLQKGYLAGRYGAIPLLNEALTLYE